MNKKIFYTINILINFLFLSLIFLKIVFAVCVPIASYSIYVDAVEPKIDCLMIEEARGDFCGDEQYIKIINKCPQIFYLEGEKFLNDSYQVYPPFLDDHSPYVYYFPNIGIEAENKIKLINGETEREWKLDGKIGLKNITIKGRTANKEPLETKRYFYLIDLLEVLLYFLIVFAIYRFLASKEKDIYNLKKIRNLLISLFIGGFILCLLNVIFVKINMAQVKTREDKREIGLYSQQIEIAQKALNEKNTDFCNQISDIGFNKACIAMANSNYNFCKKVQESDTADWCIKLIAIDLGNPDLCENILDVDTKNFCYIHIAIEKKQVSICKMVTVTKNFRHNYSDKDSCFQRIAFETKNELICGNISDDNARSDCNYKVKDLLQDEK